MDLDSVSAILRYLDSHSDVKNVHLKKIISSPDKLNRTAKGLKDAGLIDYKFQTSPKKIYWYWITDKGREVVKKIKEIDKIIES